MSDIETQARLMHKSNQVRDEINSLLTWEKEMKSKEAKRVTVPDKETFDQSYPLRNQMHSSKASTADTTTPEPSCERTKRCVIPPNADEKANEFKTRGNDCVKNNQYQKAIHYYTEAIRLNKLEPVYYTNRALCYLKQNKFKECIDDCTTAISLDAKAVKAYYRRMQAHEQLNEDLEAAFKDCKTVLQIDAKNTDARRSLSRLEGLLKVSGQKKTTQDLESAKKVEWSQFDGQDGYASIDFVTKAPHSRSKQALKRVIVVDSQSKHTPAPVDSNRTEKSTPNIDHTAYKRGAINEQNKPKIQESKPRTPLELVIPKNSAQFYKTWPSLRNDDQKFTILKGIYNSDISKILGAQFTLNLLREIFRILRSHFTNQNLAILNILSGVFKNAQMPIISAMMDDEDKLAFANFVGYMQVRGEDVKKIETLQKTYDELILM